MAVRPRHEQPISESNREAVETLRVSSAQEQFVSGVAESLVEAVDAPDARALYSRSCRRDPGRVRERYQGHGFGTAALDLLAPRPLSPWPSGAGSIQELQQLVSRQLDLLVAPLGRSVVAGDQAGSMEATEVPVDECVPRLGLFRSPLGETEMPLRVFVPGV
jgi:hypothetical protein